MFSPIAMRKLGDLMSKGYMPTDKIILTNPDNGKSCIVDEFGKIIWNDGNDDQKIKFHT